MREYQLLVINYILSLMSVTLTKPEFMKSKYKEKPSPFETIYIASPVVFLLDFFCQVKHLALYNSKKSIHSLEREA